MRGSWRDARASSTAGKTRTTLGRYRTHACERACCMVAFDRQDHATVETWRPASDGQGFEPAGAGVPVGDHAQLGQTMLDALAKAPRFPK